MATISNGKRGKKDPKDEKIKYPDVGSSFLATEGAIVYDMKSGANLSLSIETIIKITNNCREGTIGEIKTGHCRGREVMILFQNLKLFLPYK